MSSIGLIIPSYGHFDYTELAIESALECTSRQVVPILVDDGSPDFPTERFIRPAEDPGYIHVHRFTDNGGLIRAWNKGLEIARARGVDYACCANNDVIFTPGWDIPLIAALRRGFDLVGPVTNAPGSEKAQDVQAFMPGYQLSDDATILRQQAAQLYTKYATKIEEQPINGFCLLAETATWWRYAYAAEDGHVFCPRNDYNSKGEVNPTPLTTLAEYELQRRWQARRLRVGFCPGSFVLHYRSVTRGEKYKQGKWLRKKEE